MYSRVFKTLPPVFITTTTPQKETKLEAEVSKHDSFEGTFCDQEPQGPDTLQIPEVQEITRSRSMRGANSETPEEAPGSADE